MEIVLIISGFLILVIAAFVIFEKPSYIVAIFIFIVVYGFNVEMPGPLDARGFVTLIIFFRIYLFDKENLQLSKNFIITNKYFYFILIFIVMDVVVTYLNSKSVFKEPSKTLFLNIISLILGFVILSKPEGRKAFIFGILLSGLISVIDLILHYWKFGGVSDDLNIIRILDVFSSREEIFGVNHNLPGLLSGYSLIITIYQFIKKNWSVLFSAPLMILYGMGLFLSTSRSTILAIIIIILIMSVLSSKTKIKFVKIIPAVMIILFVYGAYYITYDLFLKSANKKNLTYVIYYRLYEEPLQFFGLSDSKKFDIYTQKQDKGSLSFRIKKAEHDLNKFSEKKIMHQIFGLGKDGYNKIGQRIFQYDLNKSYILGAHNAYVLIIIERGYFGLFLFLVILIGLSIKSLRALKNEMIDLPVVYLFLALALYAIGQNSELTSAFSFILLGGLLVTETALFNTDLDRFFLNSEIEN